jgi:hypothetical protein
MRRIDARRKRAAPCWFKFAQSFANLRQWLSQAMVRSTIHRRGSIKNTFVAIRAFDNFNFEAGQNVPEPLPNCAPRLQQRAFSE